MAVTTVLLDFLSVIPTIRIMKVIVSALTKFVQ